jgi:hypothetical protein
MHWPSAHVPVPNAVVRKAARPGACPSRILKDHSAPRIGAELQMLALRNGLRARGYFLSFPVLNQRLDLSACRIVRHKIVKLRPDVVHLRKFLWQLSSFVLQPLSEVPALSRVANYKALCPNGTLVRSEDVDQGMIAGKAA